MLNVSAEKFGTTAGTTMSSLDNADCRLGDDGAQSKSAVSKTCELCEKVPASVYCHNCAMYLCDEGMCNSNLHGGEGSGKHRRELLFTATVSTSTFSSSPLPSSSTANGTRVNSNELRRTDSSLKSAPLIHSANTHMHCDGTSDSTVIGNIDSADTDANANGNTSGGPLKFNTNQHDAHASSAPFIGTTPSEHAPSRMSALHEGNTLANAHTASHQGSGSGNNDSRQLTAHHHHNTEVKSRGEVYFSKNIDSADDDGDDNSNFTGSSGTENTKKKGGKDTLGVNAKQEFRESRIRTFAVFNRSEEEELKPDILMVRTCRARAHAYDYTSICMDIYIDACICPSLSYLHVWFS